MNREIQVKAASGYSVVVILLVAQLLTIGGLIFLAPMLKIIAALAGILVFICWFGFYLVHPNEGKVLQLFGRYIGTVRDAGLRWSNPLYAKRAVSLRVHNFESSRLKVNDANGSPIEIAAIVVWRVVDTAEAVFEVEDYGNYVHIQSESALRNLATSYPYEHGEHAEGLTLRGDNNIIALELQKEVQDRLEKAGVSVIEARLSHLAYASEIAQAMLQRQQANALLAARKIVVQGAVGMVTDAIEQLATNGVVELDAERKASMVSNLLVVLCGDQRVSPVVNAGTIY